MERLRALKTVVYAITTILTIQIALLIHIVKPSGFFTWSGFAVIIILCLYLIRLSLSVINELIEANQKLKK